MVDHGGATCQAARNAVFSAHHGAHVFIASDTDNDDVGLRRSLCRRRRGRAAELSAPLHGLGGAAIEYRHRKTGTRQMTGHRITHDPKADKGNARFGLRRILGIHLRRG